MFRILAQSNPAATTLTDIYTVPKGAQTFVERIYVANRSGGAVAFRVAVARNQETDNSKQYLYYDKSCAANDSVILENITLLAQDIIRVYVASQNISFNVFGEETVIATST